MSLWAFIPYYRDQPTSGRHILSVGNLPQSARRLDTNEMVDDLPGTGIHWARACGYWDLDNPDPQGLIATNHLTDAEFKVIQAEATAALAARTQRHNFIDNARTAWAAAKDILQDYVDGIPPPPQVGDPGFPTLTLALAEQQIVYLYGKTQQQASIIIGVADVVMVMAEALGGLLDNSDVQVPT